MSNEKTIKLLLKDGTLSGQIYAKNSDWNPGVLHVYPRNQVNDFFETDNCKYYGIYLLISENMVYVGKLLIFQKELNNIWTEKTGGTR